MQKTQKKLAELQKLSEVTDDLTLFLMNIEALSTKRGLEMAKKFLFGHRAMIVVDESTTIKSRSAQRTKNLIKLGDLCKINNKFFLNYFCTVEKIYKNNKVQVLLNFLGEKIKYLVPKEEIVPTS